MLPASSSTADVKYPNSLWSMNMFPLPSNISNMMYKIWSCRSTRKKKKYKWGEGKRSRVSLQPFYLFKTLSIYVSTKTQAHIITKHNINSTDFLIDMWVPEKKCQVKWRQTETRQKTVFRRHQYQ